MTTTAEDAMSESNIPETAEPSVAKATVLVHWPTGPVSCCEEHARQLIGLGNFLGSPVVATVLDEPGECVNCINERGAS